RNPAASKRNTAEQFDISPKQLREWIKKKKELKNAPPYVRRLNIGAHPTYPLLESDLMSWIKSLRSKQKAVTLHMIRTKAKQLAKQSRFTSVYLRINECKW
ncbi:11436_t:CDS:1, partial [Cetraspora pellucida]